jgi:DNA-binding CsgD family transcriptional regulator
MSGATDSDIEELSAETLDALGRSRFPAFIVDVASEKILAATPAAMELLDPLGGAVVGRSFEDFAADGPTGALSLFGSGKLTGYEAARLIRRLGSEPLPVTVWVHRYGAAGTSRVVLVVIVAGDTTPTVDLHLPKVDTSAVVGSVDEGLRIDRVSNDTSALFGSQPADLVGRSLITLVVEPDRAACLTALGQVAGSEHGVALYLHVQFANASPLHDKQPVGCQMLILPLRPSPSCAFVFVPTPAAVPLEGALGDLQGLVSRLNRGVEVARLARNLKHGLTETDLPGLSRLTTRELEISMRLGYGDRVPAIARSLFLSQSTVRSHLASIRSKLGVADQQRLVEAIRASRPPSAGLG